MSDTTLRSLSTMRSSASPSVSLSDSGLYARDPQAFADLSAQLAELRAQKDADEERWLTLEMAREALETPEN